VEAHAPDNASTATASAPRDGLSSMSCRITPSPTPAGHLTLSPVR
jgi:hypothetical protein